MEGSGGPVFIGGLDQAGKTPMRRILDASTGIAFSRRTYLWTQFAGRYGDLADDAALERCLVDLRRNPRVTEQGVDLDDVERRFRAGPRTYGRLFDIIGTSAAVRAGKQRWGDQEAGVEARADELLAAFPEARLIHLVRDPRDRHLAADRRVGPGRVGASTAMWRENARVAVRNLARHPDRCLVVRFEDLQVRPVTTGRTVASFIGEDPDAVVRAAGAWAASARARAAHKGSPTAGHPSLDRLELHYVDGAAGREMDALGYPRAGLRLSPVERLRYGGLTWPLNRLRAALWRATERRRSAVAWRRKVMGTR